jgi:hypothetical protein
LDEEQKKTTFICLGNPNLRLHYVAERQEVYNGQVVITPCRYITFIEGKYITSDPQEIAFIRNSKKFRQGMIFEPSAEDRRIYNAEKAVNVRGAVSSVNVSDLKPPTLAQEPLTVKEGLVGKLRVKEGVPDVPESKAKKADTEESLLRRCKICGVKTYTIKEDPHGRRMNMHERSCEAKHLKKERGVK